MQWNHHILFYVLDLVTSAQHTVMNNERLILAVVCEFFSNFSVNSPFSFINWNLSKAEAQRHIFSPLFLLVSVPSLTACCYSQNESDCMDSNIYSAVPHIPLKRLNLSSLIVALLSKKTPCQMKRHQRQSAAPWWETWAVPLMSSHNGPQWVSYPAMTAACMRRWGPVRWLLGQTVISLVADNLLDEKITLNHPFPISNKQNLTAPSQDVIARIAVTQQRKWGINSVY